MLRKLSIQNYAIIDELEIDFSSKLNIITGETGAGKSIIMGALGLILGSRADSSALVNKEKKCIVEGSFGVNQKQTINQFLDLNEIDNQDELLVRREIAVSGKSRAFINDTPVTLTQLGALSSMLVDLHQQFDTLAVGDEDFQRTVIDALAGNAERLQEYRQSFQNWKTIESETASLKARKNEFEKEADYNRFQYEELETAGFTENELENTDAEMKLLSNSEGIKNVLEQAGSALQDGDDPVVQRVQSLVKQLNTYSSMDSSLAALTKRLQAAQIELKDIADELEHMSARVNYDPAKIEQLSERLSLGYRLQKKHGVDSTNELITIQKQLQEKLDAVLNIDEAIASHEKQSAELRRKLLKIGGDMSSKRVAQAKPLEEKVNKLLAKVGMPNARLKVDIRTIDPTPLGMDQIDFLFDGNKSGQFQPVRKVASGGELSRLMLCIKSLVAEKVDLPTLIFDEIDTGISGEAARQVGIIMKDLSVSRQVISITHQPQIAGKADAHFFVHKQIVKDVVKTGIRLLSMEERITAIAKMLSGEKPTAAAMENAREMVSN